MTALQIHPDSREWLHGLAYVYLQHQHFEDATVLWELLLELEPDNTKIHLALAFTAFKARDFQACLSWIDQLESKLESLSADDETAETAHQTKLLKSRALWHLDEKETARELAQHYLEGTR